MSTPTERIYNEVKAKLAQFPGVAVQEYQMFINITIPPGAVAGQELQTNLYLSLGKNAFTGQTLYVPGTLIWIITDITTAYPPQIDGTLKFYKNGDYMVEQTSIISSYLSTNPARMHLAHPVGLEPQSSISVSFTPIAPNSGSTDVTNLVLADVIVINFNYSNIPQYQILQIASIL